MDLSANRARVVTFLSLRLCFFRSVDSRVVLSKQQESSNQKDNVRDRRQKGRRLIISSDENVSHMCGYDYVAWHGTGYHVSKTAA